MTDVHESSELNALVRSARAAEPSPLSTDRARELATRAVAAAETRRRDRRRKLAAAILAAAAAFVGVVSIRSFVSYGPDRSTIAVVQTSAGDRLSRTRDSDFEVITDGPRERRVALASGTVLCDVRPLGPGASFEVDAGATRVRVRGTVFSVTREDATVVRVYEGHVEVSFRGEVVDVVAGESWSSADRAVHPLDRGPLAERGEAAAAARRADEAAAANPPTEVSDLAAHAPTTSVEDAPIAAQDAPIAIAPPRDRSSAGDDASSENGRAEVSEIVARPARRPTPREAEGAIHRGDANAALDLADRAIARGEPGWTMVRADALRALGRHAQAAEAYDASARQDPAHRAEAAYAAAILRSRTLHDPAGALRSLDAGNTVESALGERALVLRVRLLVSLGRSDEARADARRYLDRYGDRGSAPAMRAMLGE